MATFYPIRDILPPTKKLSKEELFVKKCEIKRKILAGTYYEEIKKALSK